MFVDPTACGGGEATGRATVLPGAAGVCGALALSSCGGRGESVGSAVASVKYAVACAPACARSVCVAAEEATALDAGETAPAMGGTVCAGGSSEIVAVVPAGGAA
jgi:hypothetical protein